MRTESEVLGMANKVPGDDYDSDLLRGNTDSLLLSLISEHGETYGYRLIKEIEQRSQGYFRFREGTVYPALRKLENDGLITGEWKRLPNGQERRYYSITPKGQEFLIRKLAMWKDFSSAMALILKPSEG
jgi:PadR family transcriptional regulator, regulatory protein PadR